MRIVNFMVLGKPEPKGSIKAFVPFRWAAMAVAAGKVPRATVTSDNPALKSWQRAVQVEARIASKGLLFTGPVCVVLVFLLLRPTSWPQRCAHPYRKPDLDKLARGVLDGLTGTLLRDDAQVVTLQASKLFADAAHKTGVIVTVQDVTNAETEAQP